MDRVSGDLHKNTGSCEPPRIGDTANIGMPYWGSVKARCEDIRIY